MLDWMKDKLGRKRSPLQALQAGAFKDDAEKLALLEALAASEEVTGEDLVTLLPNADAAIQQRASSLFLARSNPDAVTALLEAVLADEPETRPLLMKTLVRARAEHVQPALDRILKDAKQERLRAAWETSMELSPEIADGYVERAFREGPPKARHEALRRMIARRTAEELRPTLIQALEDRDHRVRRLGIDSLVALQGNDVFEAMLDRISTDDDADVRKIAGGYLQKHIASTPPELRPAILGRLLLAGDPAVRVQLVKALFAAGSHAQLLLEILTFAKTVLGAQHAAILDSLKPLGAGLLEHVIALLGHEDPDLRIQAVLLLERLESPKTTSAVVKLLGDPDWWVRIMACDALGRLKDARALPHLLRLLDDADCKWAAIDALGAVGGEEAFAALVQMFGDSHVEVRLAAMNALGKMKDRRVDAHIEQLAESDPSLDLRVRAVELIRDRGGESGSANAAVSSSQLSRPMERLMAMAREANASDLHVTPDEPPFLRINGVIRRMEKMKPVSARNASALIDQILDPVRRPILETKGAVDFCYAIPGVGRYRVNVFRQLRGTSAVVRVIPNVAPTLATLGLPKHLDEIGTFHQGIILVTGPAGSGKSNTLTALVNVLNETRSTHVLMLEDPIEFKHAPKRALIHQREIGRDSRSFAAAMRGALREDPDVIVIGELRDKETIRLAMVAAETGHLVVATMQTTGAAATIDRLVESFPADEQAQIRVQLAGSLKLIVSQILVPRADGKGRVAACEVLKSTSPVRAIIRDGRTFQLGSAMQIGRSQGMVTLDASLEQLLNDRTITFDTAYAFAEKKEIFTKGKAPQAPAEKPPAVPADVASPKPQPRPTPAASEPKQQAAPAEVARPAASRTEATPRSKSGRPPPLGQPAARTRSDRPPAEARSPSGPKSMRPGAGQPSARSRASRPPPAAARVPPGQPAPAAAPERGAAAPQPQAAPLTPPKRTVIPRED